MKTPILLTFVAFILAACTQNKTPESIEQIYDFAETTDATFCSQDSIIATDCGGGIFYLTKKRFVLYTFNCYGSDTTSIDIGTYEYIDNDIVCTFDKKYSFFNGFNEDNEPLPYNPNNGSVKTSNKWIIRLQKTTCNNYEFGLKLQDGSKFSLSKASIENSKNYLKDLTAISELSVFWK